MRPWRAGRWPRLLLFLSSPLVLLLASECALALYARIYARSGGGTVAGAGAIVCVGDSNTEGAGATPGRSYPDQLRELIAAAGQPREVVNLGRSGLPSRMVLDRLERYLGEGGRPSFVVFLAGQNDFTRTDLFLQVDASSLPRPVGVARSFLQKLRTYRALQSLLGHLTGRTEEGARAYFDPIPPEVRLWLEDRDGELEASLARGEIQGAAAVFHPLRIAWRQERPKETLEAAQRLASSPYIAEFQRRFRHPMVFYEWEIAMLADLPRPSLPAMRDNYFLANYSTFAAAFSELAQDRPREARGILETLRGITDPYFGVYVRLHEAWTFLLERDFARAAEEFEPVLDRALHVGPQVAVRQALAGAALGQVLRDETTRLEACRAPYGSVWEQHAGGPACPIGREWMWLAEWVDARKGGDGARTRRLVERAQSEFGPEPWTPSVRYALAHPETPWETIRTELPLGPPRAAFFGPQSHFQLFRGFDTEEADRLLRPSLARLSTLASRFGFRTIVTTYLDTRATLPNERIRALAPQEGLPLLDLQVRYGEEILDKARYFSPDLHHPNEAGYGLFARAVFERVRAIESGR